MENQIKNLARMIKKCNNIVFFGGAGVSVPSGIKDYRSRDGLYNAVKEYGVSPETILSRSFFFQNPEMFYDFYRKYFIVEAKPNFAHIALAQLEQSGKLKAVITQNIDGLHQRAGSKNVIELHGTAGKFMCPDCRKKQNSEDVIAEIKNGAIPKCGNCGCIVKPMVVLYEEMLYDGVAESAVAHIASADMLIVGGTSLAVYPAASFIDYFEGKYTAVINKSEIGFDSRADVVINCSIDKVFEKVVELI